MKLAHLLGLASLSTVAVSQLLVPLQHHRRPAKATNRLHLNIEEEDQQPIAMPGPAVPSDGNKNGNGKNGNDGGDPTGSVILSDVMGRDRSINVFAGFTRDFATVTNRFDDAAQNSTVLAPLNSAIEALPRKPWEDPRDYAEGGANVYEGDDGQERAQRNLRRFVEAHIVPVSPWPEKTKAKAISGNEELWWEMKDGVKVIQPGNIEVSSVASTVANGQVWIIKGVRNYSS